MKIGLYFGSFNPIHLGHLLVATHLKEAGELDEIWFIVSPQNPFKNADELADEFHRLEMVNLGTRACPYFKSSDIEFHLPKPSYTHHTLKELTRQFPQHQFSIIMGEDNVEGFHLWKEADWIQQYFPILIYNRGEKNILQNIQNATYYRLPKFDISATNIRQRLQENKTITYLVPENVEQYIKFHKLYGSK